MAAIAGFILYRNNDVGGIEMEIYCEYNPGISSFLEQVVKYTIEKFGFDLDLSSLKSIKLISKLNVQYPTDGRTINGGTEIILTSRLYDFLPSFEIEKLYENKYFKMIVNTIYHEMVHINDWKNMPKLYTLKLCLRHNLRLIKT